jgi:hypothetical protein
VRTFIVTLIVSAFCFSMLAVVLAWAFRNTIFHPVQAYCVSGSWEPGRSTRRGFAIIHLQYEWDNSVYSTARTFGPLDDSTRVRQTLDDVQKGRDWIAINCRNQVVLVMRGMSSIAWFPEDDRSWNSVIASIVLRAVALAVLFSAALILKNNINPSTDNRSKP